MDPLIWRRKAYLETFTIFDRVQIAYQDEGKKPSVILLHGCFVDILRQFGEFDSLLGPFYFMTSE